MSLISNFIKENWIYIVCFILHIFLLELARSYGDDCHSFYVMGMLAMFLQFHVTRFFD